MGIVGFRDVGLFYSLDHCYFQLYKRHNLKQCLFILYEGMK